MKILEACHKGKKISKLSKICAYVVKTENGHEITPAWNITVDFYGKYPESVKFYCFSGKIKRIG